MKVSIIGAGNVGTSIAYALFLLQVTPHITLYNRNLCKAQAEAWDINDATPLVGACEVVPTDQLDALAQSDIVIVTIGAKQSDNETRLDLLRKNDKIIRELMFDLDRIAPEAIVIIVTNPVDIMTRIACEASVRPMQKIIGSGTILDTSRLRDFLSEHLQINQKNIHVDIIGEHGDSELPVWSCAHIGPIPFTTYPLPASWTLESLQKEAFETTRKRAYEIIHRKGYTNSAIGVSVAKLVKSILRDDRKILPVSTQVPISYGVTAPVMASIPCVIGRKGIVSQLALTLSEDEKGAFHRSCTILDQAYRSILS